MRAYDCKQLGTGLDYKRFVDVCWRRMETCRHMHLPAACRSKTKAARMFINCLHTWN